MIDTIVIAAAGKGTRFAGMTEDRPKHLLPIAGEPFFHYVLEMVRTAGFRRVIVVVGYHAVQMRAFLAPFAPIVEIVDQCERVGEKYGTAAVVEAVASEVGRAPFVFINGDTLFDGNIFSAFRAASTATLIGARAEVEVARYGTLEVDVDDTLLRIHEKSDHPVSPLVNIGLYTLQSDIQGVVRELPASPRGEFEITDALNVLAAEKKVKVIVTVAPWVEMGRPEDIPLVERFVRARVQASV